MLLHVVLKSSIPTAKEIEVIIPVNHLFFSAFRLHSSSHFLLPMLGSLHLSTSVNVYTNWLHSWILTLSPIVNTFPSAMAMVPPWSIISYGCVAVNHVVVDVAAVVISVSLLLFSLLEWRRRSLFSWMPPRPPLSSRDQIWGIPALI